MKPGFVAIATLLSVAVVGPCVAQQHHVKAKQPVKPEQPAVEAPPPTLAQMPATPPQVSFHNGQLTISAQNSTLGDILKAVKAQTGATIDFPGNASERVVGHFGPAPARDVLASLLNGSHFNYLLLGSPSDPAALDRVILMAKSTNTAPANSQPPVEQASAYSQNGFARPMAAMPAPGGNTVVVEGQDAQDGQDDATDDSADSTDDTQADDQSDQTDQGDDQQATDDQQQQPDGQPAVKTPEQLLQELQQRQQQIQQGIQPGGQPQPGFPNPGGAPGPPGVATPPHN